jgi:hypothetical protein
MGATPSDQGGGSANRPMTIEEQVEMLTKFIEALDAGAIWHEAQEARFDVESKTVTDPILQVTYASAARTHEHLAVMTRVSAQSLRISRNLFESVVALARKAADSDAVVTEMNHEMAAVREMTKQLVTSEKSRREADGTGMFR